MYLTHSMLVKRDACKAQRDLFKRIFPEGVHVTPDVCVKFAEAFQWGWAAAALLNRTNYNKWLWRDCSITVR